MHEYMLDALHCQRYRLGILKGRHKEYGLKFYVLRKMETSTSTGRRSQCKLQPVFVTYPADVCEPSAQSA